MNKLRFRDYMPIGDGQIPKWVMHTWDAASSNSDKKVLKVVMDATHSGRITNRRVYPGREVKKAMATWTSVDRGGSAGYDKPVLKHHDGHQDPIGRVVGAEFIHIKGGDEFKFDYLKPDKNGPGSGYIRLTTEISDLDSIEKILDGRIQTVSTGQTADRFLCSVCDKEMIPAIMRLFGGGEEDEDGCTHIPGRSYKVKLDSGKKETRLCFGRTIGMEYHEVSPVNFPADRFARIQEASFEDSIEDAGSFDKFEISVCEDPVMFRDFEITNEEGIAYPVVDKKVFQMPKVVSSEPTEAQKHDNIADEEQEIDLLSKAVDGTITEDEADELYDEMMEDFEDAKLSTKQRKGLSSKTFCGPNRSFPVNDCAHYTAALRLIGRYKGSGDKGRIRSCIMRKGKQMGCSGAKKSDAEDLIRSLLEDRTTSVDDILRSDEAQTLIDILNKLEEPCQKTDVGTSNDEERGSAIMKDKDKQETADKQETVDKQETAELSAAELKSLLDTLMDEKQDLTDEVKQVKQDLADRDKTIEEREASIQELQKNLEDSVKESCRVAAQSLVACGVILNRPSVRSVKDQETLETAVEELSGRTLDSLSDSLSDAIIEVLEKIEVKKEDTKGAKDFVKDDRVESKSTVIDDSVEGPKGSFEDVLSKWTNSKMR